MTRKLDTASDNRAIVRAPKALQNLIKSDFRITSFSIEADGCFIYTEVGKWCNDHGEHGVRDDTVSAAIRKYKDRVLRATGNTDPLLSLTRAQVLELAHKFAIMCDEPDLRDSYGLTVEQAEAAHELFSTIDEDVSSFLIPLPMAVAEAALGEMENVVEIAEDNHNAEGSGETSSWLRTARDGVKRIRAAIEEVTRVYSPA